jgi:DNA-binding transcriptional MerR regulator
MSIKEFANVTNVPESLLRFYDNQGIFLPKQRGSNNNYRSYSLEQCLDFSTISMLRQLDLPLGGIAGTLQNRAVDKMLSLLIERQGNLDRQMERISALQEMNNVLQTFLLHYRDMEESPVELLELTPQEYRYPEPPGGEQDRRVLTRLMNYKSELLKKDMAAAFLVGFSYEDMARFEKASGQPSRFFSLPVQRKEGEAAPHLTLFAKGFPPSEETAANLAQAAKERGLAPAGPVICEIVRGELCEESVEEYLIRILIRVERKK